MIRWTICFVVLPFSTGCGLLQKPVTYESLLNEMVDRDAIARYPKPYYTCREASSYDRAATSPEKPETWFANKDENQFIRTEENGGRKEWVLLDADGPGAVVRFWSANPRDEITIRFYLDGAKEPALAARMTDLLGGKWRVPSPLSAVRAKGWNLYLPIPYARHCKVTSDADKIFYQINYRTYEPGTPVQSFSMWAFNWAEPTLKRVCADLASGMAGVCRHVVDWGLYTVRLDPGESKVVFSQKAAGIMREMGWLVEAADVEQACRDTVIRIVFDGEETVWCPMGDFFASGLGDNTYLSWWMDVGSSKDFHCRWPMPFRESMVITLENLGNQHVKWSLLPTPDNDWQWDDRSMHFHATWRRQKDVSTEKKQDWNFVEIQGRGVYVGDMLAVMNPTTVWWGEGDEKIYVDGETFPSHFGTGTEDYYGYAWGDWNRFEAPFHAQPRVDGPIVLGNTTLMRTRSLDAIPFSRSLKFDMEIWHWRKVLMDYAAVTYYYALPGAKDNRGADRTKESLGVPAPPQVYRVDGAIEAETMEIVSKPADAEWKQEANWWNTQWSGDAQAWFGCKHVGDAVELRCPLHCEGPTKLTLYATRYPDYGIIQVSVNGQPFGGSIDLCNTKDKGVAPTGPIELGIFEAIGESAVIRFEVVGSNPSAPAPGTYFGLDCLVLTPVEPIRTPDESREPSAE